MTVEKLAEILAGLLDEGFGDAEVLVGNLPLKTVTRDERRGRSPRVIMTLGPRDAEAWHMGL